MHTLKESHVDELIKRTCFNEIVPNYNEINGYVVGCNYKKLKHLIDEFDVRDNDVWVTSYPKSGTTWTQEMVWLIVNNLNYEDAKRPIEDRFPFLELETLYDWDIFVKLKGEMIERVTRSIQYTFNDKSYQRCIKSHLPWDLLPNDIKEKKKQPKIIHVMRNPKDVCVSFFHHYKLLHFYTGTFTEFETLFLQDKLLFSPYWKVVNSYLMKKDDPNLLIIKYEDMKTNLKSVVIEVAKFLNKIIPDNEIDKLLEHLSFDSMQNNPNVHLKYKEAEDGTLAQSEAQFIRKGIVGEHKSVMTPDVIAQFDNWIAKNNALDIIF